MFSFLIALSISPWAGISKGMGISPLSSIGFGGISDTGSPTPPPTGNRYLKEDGSGYYIIETGSGFYIQE